MKLKVIVVLALIGLSAASKLSNKYLPPSSAASAGGHGSFLQTPPPHGHRPSNQYLPPQSKHYHGGSNAGKSSNRPSSQYLPPQSRQPHGGPNDGNSDHHPSNQYLPPKSKQYNAGVSHGKSQHHRQQSSHGPQVATVRSENSNKPDGSYHYAFDTANGIHRQENGHLRNAKSAHPEQVVKGSYSYTGDDGQLYKVRYTADSGGFQAHGDHLPTASKGSHGNRKPQGGERHQHHSGSSGTSSGSAASAGYSARSPSKQYLPPSPSVSPQSAGYSYNRPGGQKW